VLRVATDDIQNAIDRAKPQLDGSIRIRARGRPVLAEELFQAEAA